MMFTLVTPDPSNPGHYKTCRQQLSSIAFSRPDEHMIDLKTEACHKISEILDKPICGYLKVLIEVELFITSGSPIVADDECHRNEDAYDENYSPFFYLWLVAAVVSSIYAYVWDIKMDWGFFDKNAGENLLLRAEIVYRSKAYYYFAVIEDFLLRFGWTFSVCLTEMGVIHGEIILTVLAPLEVIRRFIWNFFRLENEHLNNCGNFRAVRDISVTPIDKDDLTTMLKMMDESDGVDNRKRNKKTGRLRRMDTKSFIEITLKNSSETVSSEELQ
ncbi:Xenotropic and polytropic retrovirus receptor 1 [Nymphon striatum]|nr:Xenotropic and polytropic retrovirus receptor 1 [Nymphon striatum]